MTLRGLAQPVEILRDRWGVPHIYASTEEDLFFAQGYMAARDRLFQIDLWRRAGSGHLAEVLGPGALARDRIARLVSFRGDWNAEWSSYHPNTRRIAAAFTAGINAYIESLGGVRPLEFRLAGYDPAPWTPRDVASRIAGLLMTRNVTREVQRALDIREMGLETVRRYLPPDPLVPLRIPTGLDLDDITRDILGDYGQATGGVRFPESSGSNNWVAGGELTATGKPLLASDPHRGLQIPSLRRTVHLVAPGWNVYGAGEPSLPGVALGHNEEIGFGFTIVGIDQADLYVERLNPRNPNQYLYKGKWREMEVRREQVAVRGAPPRTVSLRYTVHGPVIAEKLGAQRAYALRWVGAEPGTAGYLAGLSLSQARDWEEFRRAAARYHVPSENLLYADRAGNIGWLAAGKAPLRRNWTGLLPVPGHTGEYEWSGFLPAEKLPRLYNPARGYIATANHNILPPGYSEQLSYEWSPAFRFHRVEEMIQETIAAGRKFTGEDFERMQQDVVSLPARRFQGILRAWKPAPGGREEAVRRMLLAWDARITADSVAACIFEVWIAKLPVLVLGGKVGRRADLSVLLDSLERRPRPDALLTGLRLTLSELERRLGKDRKRWQWGRLHTLEFQHPLRRKEWSIGPRARGGDAYTVNAASGSMYRMSNGASFRMVLDLDDWDRSVMTNVPGESGNPDSPHYRNLLEGWLAARYHPMVYSREAVEEAAVERIQLLPREDAGR